MSHSNDCPCLESLPSHWNALSSSNQTLSNSYLCNLLYQNSAVFESPGLNCTFPDDPAYGLSCKAHDLSTMKNCQGPVTPDTPRYCFAKWCFVDVDKCFHSNHTFFQDKRAPALYYSYSTCSGSTSFDNLEEERFNTLDNEDITVVLPEYVFPYNFKPETEPDNIFPVFEYTDLQGAIIEYFDLIRKETKIKSLSYQIISGGSRKKFGDSTYTAAVNDVSNQLADIGGGVFWVTAERLNLAPFTVPLFYSSIYLLELQKKERNPFFFSVKNTLRPFNNYLWFVLVLCIVMVGIVNVFSSNTRSHSEWHRLLYENNQKLSSRFQRTRAAILVYASSINKSFVEYYGSASETLEMSTFSHKILVFGFGFFILVVCSTYTANLASFLTVKDFGIYVESMDEAIESNLKICAPRSLGETLTTEFPKLKRDNVKYINLGGYQYISEASDKLKTGECDVMVADELDLHLININEQEDFCKKGVVSINTIVTTLPQPIPVDPKFQAHLSKGIVDLRMKGVLFIDILKQYAPPMKCDIFLDSKNMENAQMKPAQMYFPMGLLFICMIIGTISKIVVIFRKPWLGNDLERENNENVDISPKIGNSSMKDTDLSSQRYLDMLEYKYRLELISLNVQQLDNCMSKHLQNYEDGKVD